MIEVDLKGLAKLLERKGVEWIALELIQNAWDTETSMVDVKLTREVGSTTATLVVTDDDPNGFQEMSHAWTLFAESAKKDNPELRGRFNMGEKLVLAYCLAYGGSVEISTTKGTIVFRDGERKRLRRKRDRGSQITCVMKMSKGQMNETLCKIHSLFPPVPTWVNSTQIYVKSEILTVRLPLPTVIADEEGVLRSRVRKTNVKIYPVDDGDTAMIYELGIPVVETGDKWHYDVQQKVPLNMERDNVQPAYLKTVRTHVLNEMYEHLDDDDSTETWVKEASSDKRCTDGAVDKVMEGQYGESRVYYDPSDVESNKIAMSRGYTVVPQNGITKGQWSNLKRSGGLQRSGKVTPTPKPFSETGEPLVTVPIEDWSYSMCVVSTYAKDFAEYLGIKQVSVVYANDPSWHFTAAYGSSNLTLNWRSLKGYIEGLSPSDTVKLDSIFIHEFAHHYSSDHFSHKFLNAACDIGAKLARFRDEWQNANSHDYRFDPNR